MACSTGLCFSASILPLPASCSSGSSHFLTIERVSSSPSLSRWTIQYKQLGHTLYRRSHVLAFASADVCIRLFEHHKAKEAQRRRQAEAINGALAMIGLTAGLVVEAHTGKGILGQLVGYLTAISSLFGQ
ncbi:uncharacterized protein [Miscanthus floridulus]|uniref:uncharacterized protein isoform X2 n=1 Tax=Miscanthus floridulus TaxID=154761 RepID=UPI00345B0B4A